MTTYIIPNLGLNMKFRFKENFWSFMACHLYHKRRHDIRVWH